MLILCVIRLILRIDTCGRNQGVICNCSDWAYYVLTHSIQIADTPEPSVLEIETCRNPEDSTKASEDLDKMFNYSFDEVANRLCVCCKHIIHFQVQGPMMKRCVE